jgi:acetyltransferase-like isoleucine patch superfamily enzyme
METHQNGRILIEEDVSIGQNFHITSAKELLRIGTRTTISGNVFITNIDHDYRAIDRHILEQEYIIKTTSIGENCFIGYGASIQAGTILGKQCVVGTNAVVRGIFPDYCVLAGVPARIIKKYNLASCRWEKYNGP